MCEGVSGDAPTDPAPIALSANVENYAVKEASNADVLIYSGCAVAALLAFVWQVKRAFVTKKNADAYESAETLKV